MTDEARWQEAPRVLHLKAGGGDEDVLLAGGSRDEGPQWQLRVTNTRSPILSSLMWTVAGLSTELHSTDRQTSFDSTVRVSATPWNALHPALSTSTSNL